MDAAVPYSAPCTAHRPVPNPTHRIVCCTARRQAQQPNLPAAGPFRALLHASQRPDACTAQTPVSGRPLANPHNCSALRIHSPSSSPRSGHPGACSFRVVVCSAHTTRASMLAPTTLQQPRAVESRRCMSHPGLPNKPPANHTPGRSYEITVRTRRATSSTHMSASGKPRGTKHHARRETRIQHGCMRKRWRRRDHEAARAHGDNAGGVPLQASGKTCRALAGLERSPPAWPLDAGGSKSTQVKAAGTV